jgi:hypothetical protein
MRALGERAARWSVRVDEKPEEARAAEPAEPTARVAMRARPRAGWVNGWR